MSISPGLQQALRAAGLEPEGGRAVRPVGGGDISDAYRVPVSDGWVFLKAGGADELNVLQAEADGLVELARPAAIRVPGVLATGCYRGGSFLALEWIEFDRGDACDERLFGRQLAALHRSVAGKHGWYRDNRIGLTPQPNPWTADWCEFWKTHRLGYQLELAGRNGFGGELRLLGGRLIEELPGLLAGHQPPPSLLHGDLWAGNRGFSGGVPVIFDPAVYYGDRETDLAMTRLFGGFGSGFYEAYEAAWPLPAGHDRRLPLYQLYHVLNHLNLFGGAYLGRAESLLRRLLCLAQ
ncbi:MAG: fructosamine kinase family protein [Gammaproteobacteria bacterium]|nr:fructosamine kinase family protein [Gammaproteobacteria bacterium]MDH4256175.1 fructosamine kinase family protein [Gammaproteobacteria bacterium]MDH5311596.1 fructosamine kinase family protein [Gammaproteobacteria bacterium]